VSEKLESMAGSSSSKLNSQVNIVADSADVSLLPRRISDTSLKICGMAAAVCHLIQFCQSLRRSAGRNISRSPRTTSSSWVSKRLSGTKPNVSRATKRVANSGETRLRNSCSARRRRRGVYESGDGVEYEYDAIYNHSRPLVMKSDCDPISCRCVNLSEIIHLSRLYTVSLV
jgi:hypothetical protein